MMNALNEIAQPVRQPSVSLWRTAVVLFKLRIVSLLLLSAFGGAGLGTMIAGRASAWDWVLLAITGTLSAAGASGINQYLERERDSKMNRTAARPLATGQIENPQMVLLLGVGMVLGATGLATAFNLALAFWVFLGAAIYVGVYTVWLKPRTTLNIVIGGAAGSCAVISGGAAVGAWSALGVWILAALVFVWTPVHFWALALAYRSDYIKADYPMLPARVPPIVAARWTAVHTILTAAAGMALGFWPTVDWFYLVPIGLATAVLIVRTAALLIAPAEKAPAFALFHFSNLYLALVLVVVLLASLWR
ncbi:heme o synthase [Candidatus Leptofilum sp.]|uniref:heme o synthase n=1 Tax=Candidatus Leptofilum sp. TaxID=3241576 RepID=UPI003B5C7960